MSWDIVQRDVLQALGHTVYRTAPRDAAAAVLDPLLQAVLLASGRRPDADDAAGLCRKWNASALRGNATAKRALWPGVRALRADVRVE